MKWIKRGVLLFLLAIIPAVYAVDNPSSFRLWAFIDKNGTFSNHKILYTVELHNRLGNAGLVFHQSILRLGLGYSLTSRVSVLAGYDFAPTLLSSNVLRYEQRTWQQILYTPILSDRIGVALRSRLEERYDVGTPGVNFRLRERLAVTFVKAMDHFISPVVFDAVFISFNQVPWLRNNGALDQNRFFIGVNIPISRHSVLQVGYLNQFLCRRPRNIEHHVLYLALLL